MKRGGLLASPACSFFGVAVSLVSQGRRAPIGERAESGALVIPPPFPLLSALPSRSTDGAGLRVTQIFPS
jgi:hypothetical protein